MESISPRYHESHKANPSLLPSLLPSPNNHSSNCSSSSTTTHSNGLQPTPPPTPPSLPHQNQHQAFRHISRSESANPYPTTFVQADTSSFKQVVQMLTGSSETTKHASSSTKPTTNGPAYDDRDILDRLRVKMMPHETGDIGWDVFSLEYDARVPLDTVFTESVMAMYLIIFNFLWKLRRVEHALIGAWKIMKPNCITSHSFTKLQRAVKFQLLSTLRRCQVLWDGMNHFVTNLQYYIMFEVLEVSWSEFSSEMEVARDLDDLLAAHEKYLHSIVEKSLLGERSQTLCKSLFVLFDLILRFRSNTDRLYEGICELQARTTESSIPSQDKSKSRRQLSDKASKPGSWIGDGRKALTQRASEFFRNMGQDLDAIAKEYSSLLEGFLSQLPVQQHVDLKFLLFRLDFTEFYSSSVPSL